MGLWQLTPGIEGASASAIAAATAPSGLLSEAAVAGNMGLPSAIGTELTLGGLLGPAALGFGAGTLLNSFLGGKTTGGTVGSGVGALGGAALGSLAGPFGTIAGALLGGASGFTFWRTA